MPEVQERPRECGFCGESIRLDEEVVEAANSIGMHVIGHVQCFLDRKNQGWEVA